MGISVPFIRHSIWGLSNSQQYLGCLQHPGNHQHNQIQRLRRTDLKGLPSYPDNSVSLKRRVTVCPTPGCILEQWSDSAHFPAQKGRWFRHLGLQETQGRRPRKLEMMVGRHTSRVPRSQGMQSFKELAGWIWPKPSKARLHYPQFLLLGQNVLSNRNNFFMSKIILFPNVFLFSLRYFINTEQWSFSWEQILV